MYSNSNHLTDDLYSDAEDQLPWAPIREDSSPDVKRYMEGFVAGTVAEGMAVSSLGVGLVTKSSTAIRGTLAASRQGKVALTMLSNIRKATNSAVDVLSQLARSKADAAKFGAIGRYLGKTELPSGRNAAEAFADALPGKTLLSRKVLKSWDEAWPDLDEARRITRYQRCTMSVAELKDIMGDALSDDALEAFGKLQPRLFVNPDVDDADVFRKFTELFDTDTPGGKAKLNEFLEDSKVFLNNSDSSLPDGGFPVPDYAGFEKTPTVKTLAEGTIIDRYGLPTGGY
jgi:hypothetical protein